MESRVAGGPGSAGIGRIYIWNGGSLLIGQSRGATDVHAHHAVQIALTSGPAFRFRSESGDWREYRGVAITPDYPHAFDGLSETVAHVFVEPESREGRAIMERLGRSGIVAIEARDADAAIRDLFAAWASTRAEERMIAAGQAVITHFAGGPTSTRAIHGMRKGNPSTDQFIVCTRCWQICPSPQLPARS